MNYEEAKKYIKDGDVLTFAGSWRMSRLIRFWTGQKVSHVGIAIWLRFGQETEDRLCVLESMEPGGVRIIPLSMALKESNAVYWQKLDSALVDAHEALGWAIQQWGGKYASWLQFLSFISPRFRKLREWRGFPAKVGSGYHCSELIAEALKFGGYKPPKDPALVTPGDIWDFKCLGEPVLIEK